MSDRPEFVPDTLDLVVPLTIRTLGGDRPDWDPYRRLELVWPSGKTWSMDGTEAASLGLPTPRGVRCLASGTGSLSEQQVREIAAMDLADDSPFAGIQAAAIEEVARWEAEDALRAERTTGLRDEATARITSPAVASDG